MDARSLFEILVRENAAMLRAFLLSSVRDTATAEDLVQESFLVAWKNLDRYDRQLPFGPWLRGIATNLLLNHARRQQRSKLYYCDAEALSMLDRRFEEFQALAGDTAEEKMSVMRGCMQSLTQPQRQAIELHYEHGLHCKEIARRLQCGLEAVKKHLQRGRAGLLRCMRRKLGAAALGGGVS